MSKIAFFNQGSGRLFCELVEAAAAEFGAVTYYSPDAPLLRAEGVHTMWTPRHRSFGALPRLLGWIGFLVVAGARGLMERDCPLFFIVTNPPFALVLGPLARLLKRQRYVLLFYDMWPEALVHFGGSAEHSPLVRLWRQLNRVAVRRSEQVITISSDLARTLAQYEPRAMHVIPTWVDTDRIRPMPKVENPFARQHGLVDKFIVLYAGNLGAVHDVTLLPAVADRLRTRADIQFVIVGEGLGRASLVAECERRGLSNLLFLPRQEEAILPQLLAAGDVGVVALAMGAEGISMPSKTYYTMAAGSAVLGLCQADSDLDRVIRQHACGTSVAPDDVDRAAQAILEWRDQPEKLREQQTRARYAAEQFYSRAVCVPQMLQVIKEALG